MAPLLAQTDTDVEETLSELSSLTAADWIVAGSIIVGAIIIGLLVQRLSRRAFLDRSGTLVANLIGRLALFLILAIGFVYALNQVGVSMAPLLGLLGLLGLAFALAFQEVLGNVIAGVMLSIRRLFKIGDEIRSAGYEGTVEDVTLRTVTLRTFDGVRVFIPNSTVWQEPLENTTALNQRRTTLALGVGYDSDLDEAQELMLDSLRSIDGVRDDPSPQALVHEFGDSSINFAVRFWHEPHIADEWRVRDTVARRLKRDLDGAGIEIPFPQIVLHRSPSGNDE
ncbi:MAG: mechanosensitive ion channel family protein [Actinobacteria bacterium]|nr:MAG: mechanosensitive ion channel family protein [Actinomycetota bacterium]